MDTHAQTMNENEDWCMIQGECPQAPQNPEAAEAPKASEAPDAPKASEAPDAPAGVALRASDAGLTYAIKVPQELGESGCKPLNIKVLFCLDVSSSMAGEGINALKDMIRTMPKCAEELKRNTFFGTVAVFSSKCHVLPCAQQPEKLSDWTPEKTQQISNKLFAMGMTNFDEALSVATGHARNVRDDADACVILLATDGEVSTGKIQDAESLRTRFLSDRNGMPVYVAPIAIGPMPNAAYLTTLASKESFISFAKGAEEASGAVVNALKAFDDARCVFDVTVSIKRLGSVDPEKEQYTVNFGFVTNAHNTATGTLDYNLKAGDEVELTFPGGKHWFVVGDQMETSRDDLWEELEREKLFEDVLKKVDTLTQKMTLKDTAMEIKQQMSGAPVHRSLSARVEAVVEALLAQPDPVVGKRMSDCGLRSLGDDQDESDGDITPAPMFRSIGQSYRSLAVEQPPYSYNSRDLAWAAIRTRSAF
tara:strand:+ start:1420 stop:2853 length:1434 start_codon:yes stop_codon:yes gene_type:complete